MAMGLVIILTMMMMTVLAAATASVPVGRHLWYQPTLSPNEVRELPLWLPYYSPFSMAFFRVIVPKSPDSNYFEVTFSACLVGTIRVHYSSCVMGTEGCDDGSAQWFPNSTNAHMTHYSVVAPELQQMQSIGRIANTEPNITVVHYYGVEIVSSRNGMVRVQATLDYYRAGGISQTFTSSSQVSMDLGNKTLSWDKLVQCRSANSSDPSKCETEVVVEPIEYTVYIMKSESGNGNLGTTCGMRHPSPKVKRIVTRAQVTELNIASMIESNGTYLVGVGARAAAGADFTLDFAYRPLLFTVHREDTDLRPALFVVPLVVVVLALTGIIALAGVTIWFKRRVAIRSEFTQLT